MHAINKQTFEFSCTSEDVANALRVEIDSVISVQINQIISSVLMETADNDGYLKIETMEIDLGDISLEDFGTNDMLVQFKNLFKQKIAAFQFEHLNRAERAGVTDRSNNDFEITQLFLLHGDVPWWADKNTDIQLDKMLHKVIDSHPRYFTDFLEKHGLETPVLTRIAEHYKPSAKLKIGTMMSSMTGFKAKSLFGRMFNRPYLHSLSMENLFQLRSLFENFHNNFHNSLKRSLLATIESLERNTNLQWIQDVLSALNDTGITILPVQPEKSSAKLGKKLKEIKTLINSLNVFQMELLLLNLTTLSESVWRSNTSLSSNNAQGAKIIVTADEVIPGKSFFETIASSAGNIVDPDQQGNQSGATGYLPASRMNNLNQEAIADTSGSQPSVPGAGMPGMEATSNQSALNQALLTSQQDLTDIASSEGKSPSIDHLSETSPTFEKSKQNGEPAPVLMQTSNFLEDAAKLKSAIQMDSDLQAGEQMSYFTLEKIPIADSGKMKSEIPADTDLQVPLEKNDINLEKVPFDDSGKMKSEIPADTDLQVPPEKNDVNLEKVPFDESWKLKLEIPADTDLQVGMEKTFINLEKVARDDRLFTGDLEILNRETTTPSSEKDINKIEDPKIDSEIEPLSHDQNSSSPEPGSLNLLKKGPYHNDLSDHINKINKNAVRVNLDNRGGAAHSNYEHPFADKISFIMMTLKSDSPSLLHHLQMMDAEHLADLAARFQDHLMESRKWLSMIKKITTHPYFLKYNILGIFANLNFENQQHSDSPDKSSQTTSDRQKEKILSQHSKKIQISQADLLTFVNHLSLKELALLRDAFQKKKFDQAHQKKVVIKLLRRLPAEGVILMQYLTELPEEEIRILVSGEKNADLTTATFESKSYQNAPPVFYSSSSQEERKIIIENAGLCLIANYLPGLFKRLGYLENKMFKSEALANRALYLLQNMVTAKLKNPEYLLQLNKLLCGFEVSDVVLSSSRLLENEILEGENLLSSVIENWSKLKGTSISGFRESFLQRKGILIEKEAAWSLTVERKGFDMLLSTIPWGFSLIKLPWMKKHINVEW